MLNLGVAHLALPFGVDLVNVGLRWASDSLCSSSIILLNTFVGARDSIACMVLGMTMILDVAIPAGVLEWSITETINDLECLDNEARAIAGHNRGSLNGLVVLIGRNIDGWANFYHVRFTGGKIVDCHRHEVHNGLVFPLVPIGACPLDS